MSSRDVNDKTADVAAGDVTPSGAVVGIQEFLHHRQTRVTGVLKQHPSDFVVCEISATNEIVTLGNDANVTRLPTSDERAAVLQRKLDEQQAKTPRNEKLTFDKPPNGWHTTLRETIGVANAQHVEAVANEQRSEWLFNAPTEFRDRVFVQVCVQNCFPGLECKLRKPKDDDDREATTQILVLLDPLFTKLRAANVTRDNCVRLVDYVRKGAGDPLAVHGVALDHEDSKAARTHLHRALATAASCFKTTTTMRNNQQTLVALFSDRTKKKRKRSQQQEPDVYVQFVLEKTNIEHFACFDALARTLQRPLSAFSYAGTKDKVAITTQHVVVGPNVAPAALLAVNTTAKDAANPALASTIAGIRVGHLEYVSAPISLGSANGNRFTITVRDVASVSSVDAADDELKQAIATGVAAVTRTGFINYFGFQRVGHPSHSVRPHHIGQQMLANDYKAVVTLLLTPGEREPDAQAAAKRAFIESSDVDAALKQLPTHLTLERAVLQGLKRFGADSYRAAVESVSFTRRLMYLHAYQSVVFNAMATARLQLFGQEIVAGDLVRDATTGVVAVVTADEAAQRNEGTNPLADIVLPLAGANVLLPANAIGDKYRALLEQHKTAAALLSTGAGTTTGMLKGSYRSLVVMPTDVTWSFEADAKVLRTSFSLPTGAFATMCLREILQTDM